MNPRVNADGREARTKAWHRLLQAQARAEQARTECEAYAKHIAGFAFDELGCAAEEAYRRQWNHLLDDETPRADTRELFEALTTRKPDHWLDMRVVAFASLMQVQQEALRAMPVVQTDDRFAPTPTRITDPIFQGTGQAREFVLVHGDAVYYVNTEGYTYARYVMRITGFPGFE